MDGMDRNRNKSGLFKSSCISFWGKVFCGFCMISTWKDKQKQFCTEDMSYLSWQFDQFLSCLPGRWRPWKHYQLQCLICFDFKRKHQKAANNTWIFHRQPKLETPVECCCLQSVLISCFPWSISDTLGQICFGSFLMFSSVLCFHLHANHAHSLYVSPNINLCMLFNDSIKL